MRTYASAAILTAALALSSALTAHAMPPFAQGNQVDCSTCHSMVPALNAYGRYIERTAYSGLDYHVLRSNGSPFWVSERVRTKSTANLDRLHPGFTTTTGNVSLDAVGVANAAFSYRVEQTLYSNNLGGGGLGRAWVSYNKLLNGRGHVIVGKFGPSIPEMFSGVQDVTGFGSGSLSVGKHKYALNGTRWGAKFNYVGNKFDVEMNWGAGSSNLVNGGDFSTINGSDKVLEWQAAYADPMCPLEFGIFGGLGANRISSAILDRYAMNGVYVQRDPYRNFPGFYTYYEQYYDSNPGQAPIGAPKGTLPYAVTSHAAGFEIFEPFLQNNVMLSVRPFEFTSNGLGVIKHGSQVDLAARIPHLPYLFFYGESAFGANSSAPFGRPTWQFGLRYAGPITSGPINRIH